MITGITTYGILASFTSLILPQVFNIFDLTLFDAPSLLLFVGFTFYAIVRHHLFNTKVVATELFVVALSCFIFFRILIANSIEDKIANGILLAVSIVIGILLIRSILKEIHARELIEKQEKELELANREQESLLHFISHEIKGYLTKGQNAFAEIIEGDYGAVCEPVRQVSSTALTEMRKGVAMVMTILDASNLKKGTVTFKKISFDFKSAVIAVVDQLRSSADKKGIAIKVDITPVKYDFEGDEEKLREHVIRNLIDNAIKYTPRGEITVSLYRTDHKLRFAVHDSGVGITSDDMSRLFTEGGRGKDSIKVNVDSTGYGLFIAKRIVEAHGGKIWAESEGEGKGSTFIVELPVLSQANDAEKMGATANSRYAASSVRVAK